ncbi:hypothetical protein E2C01_089515 [Portunus trituberculatus]|uniref:Uncharacterized protein n=1 Tax=Portunus trituberculatus TaxID=210409 RepID=A0A5B7JC84_PORTR|nr:hypothetical protein [Portunus trituberculatus]
MDRVQEGPGRKVIISAGHSSSRSKLPKIAIGASNLLAARQQVCLVSPGGGGRQDITHAQINAGKENSR